MEMEELKDAFTYGESSYELKYNVEVEKKFMGLQTKIIKENKNED